MVAISASSNATSQSGNNTLSLSPIDIEDVCLVFQASMKHGPELIKWTKLPSSFVFFQCKWNGDTVIMLLCFFWLLQLKKKNAYFFFHVFRENFLVNMVWAFWTGFFMGRHCSTEVDRSYLNITLQHVEFLLYFRLI